MQGKDLEFLIPYSEKFSILLPRKQHFAKLVIMQSHENVKHNGVRECNPGLHRSTYRNGYRYENK